jgi:hypothetical protein
MFDWLTAWYWRLKFWALQRDRDRLIAGGQRFRADWRAANGDSPFRITTADRRRLDELAQNLDPEWVEQHSIFADAEIVEHDDQ